MLDFVDIDGDGEVVEVLFTLAAGAVALAAAKYYAHKYRDTLYNWVQSRLANHPSVRRVFLRALQINYRSCEAIKTTIKGKVYILAQLVGVNSSKHSEVLATPSLPKSESTVRDLSEDELLRMGFIPEKVAKGMGLIDKNGNIKGMHEVCSESKVMELKMA